MCPSGALKSRSQFSVVAMAPDSPWVPEWDPPGASTERHAGTAGDTGLAVIPGAGRRYGHAGNRRDVRGIRSSSFGTQGTPVQTPRPLAY